MGSFTVGSHLDPSSFPSKPNKASCIVFCTSALTFKRGNFFKHVFVKVCSEQPSSIVFFLRSLRLADSEHASKLFSGISGMVSSYYIDLRLIFNGTGIDDLHRK